MNSEKTPTLTERQLEILELVTNGYSNKAICDELYLSESTVKSHMFSLKEKLQANNRAHAVAIGISLGLVKLRSIEPPSLRQENTASDEELLKKSSTSIGSPGVFHETIFAVEPLTEREYAILSCFATSDYPLSNQELADSLCISKETVRSHLRNIYSKLVIPDETIAGQKRRMLAKVAIRIMGKAP